MNTQATCSTVQRLNYRLSATNQVKAHHPHLPLSLTTYKTARCSSTINEMTAICQYGSKCFFSHSNEEIRRNPFSVCDVAYEPIINQEGSNNIKHCRNDFEYLYHPENYKTEKCTHTVLGCANFVICPYWHNEKDLKVPLSTQEKTSLVYLARYQKWEEFKNLLNQAPPEKIMEDKYPLTDENCVHYVCKYAHSDFLADIIKKCPKIDLNYKDRLGQTPLHKAAGYAGGFYSIHPSRTLQILIDSGANPTHKDLEGYSAMDFIRLKKDGYRRAPLQIIDYLYGITKLTNSSTLQSNPQSNPKEIDSKNEDHFVYNSIIPSEEGLYCEFKKYVFKSPAAMLKALPPYISGFLNLPSKGIPQGKRGQIYFGVEDNGCITGMILDAKDHPLIRDKIKACLHCSLSPPPSSDQFTIEFIPVYNSKEEKLPDCFVIKISVVCGSPNIHLINGIAYVRSGSTLQKVKCGSQMQQLYESCYPDKIISEYVQALPCPTDESSWKLHLQNYSIEDLLKLQQESHKVCDALQAKLMEQTDLKAIQTDEAELEKMQSEYKKLEQEYQLLLQQNKN
jgi:hypothetical protein